MGFQVNQAWIGYEEKALEKSRQLHNIDHITHQVMMGYIWVLASHTQKAWELLLYLLWYLENPYHQLVSIDDDGSPTNLVTSLESGLSVFSYHII